MSEQPTALPQPILDALACSRFLRRQLDSRSWLAPRLAASVAAPLDATTMRDFLRDEKVDENTLKPVLRRLRAWVICHVMVRDLARLADLAEVTETMTVLADIAVETAHDIVRSGLVARHGMPVSADGREQEFIIIGMGKLGGRELNVSSDIDLIYVYPEDGSTAGPKIIDNFEFFTKLGRGIIQALNGQEESHVADFLDFLAESIVDQSTIGEQVEHGALVLGSQLEQIVLAAHRLAAGAHIPVDAQLFTLGNQLVHFLIGQVQAVELNLAWAVIVQYIIAAIHLL